MESAVVSSFLRRFRSPLIAIVAVVFSAGIVIAGQPASNASAGLANAASHAGKTVPEASDEPSGSPDESTDKQDSANDSADNCSTDPTGLTADQLAAMTHGSVVCWAAQQPTPSGFANHGAWVKSWATKNKGADAAATGQSHRPSH